MAGERTTRQGQGTITAGQHLLRCLILRLILKYKIIIKMNLN